MTPSSSLLRNIELQMVLILSSQALNVVEGGGITASSLHTFSVEPLCLVVRIWLGSSPRYKSRGQTTPLAPDWFMRQTKLHRHRLMANPASSTLRIQKYTASCVTTSKHSSELTPPKPISRHASLMRASLPENDHVAHSNLS